MVVNLSKREIKIFFTFFIIYSFFVHWIGWGENSRFALTRAIIDENRVEIDTYANQTSDRAYFGRHYYSEKDPGLSLLSVPVFTLWKFIHNFFPPSHRSNWESNKYVTTLVGMYNIPIIEYVNPGWFILTSMVLLTIFTSSLLSALTVLLVYKISMYLTKKETHRITIIIIYALSTLAFPYSLVFYEHAVALFFAFSSFYILFKIKNKKIRKNQYVLLAGVFSGFSMTVSFISVIITLGNLVYLLTIDRRKVLCFIIGGFLGVTPFLIYNYTAFGTPFTLPRHHLDSKIWPRLGGIYGLQPPNPLLMLRLTLYPYKGLFFYYPILFLSIIGLFYFYKEFKIESLLCIYIFLAFLIMNSSWWAWWGGASFGPRHLSLTIPFLVLPLISFFKRIKGKNSLRYFIFFLVMLSIIINFSGLEASKEPISLTTFTLKPLYAERINTFSILENPIYDYHIPNFILHGPRSRLFEHLINSRIPDIRDVPLSSGRFFPVVGGFHIPFLCLLPLVIITIIIWKTELFEKGVEIKESSIYFEEKNISFSTRWGKFISKHRKKFSLIISTFLLIVLITAILKTQIKLIDFELNWYDPIPQEDVRWMQQNGTISLLNPSENVENKRLYFYVKSFHKDREVTIYLNDDIVIRFDALNQGSFVYSPIIELKPGKNTLRFHSEQECDAPYFAIGLEDFRCLSIGIRDLTLKSIGKDEMLYSQNWYMEEENWMKNNGTILIVNSVNKTKEVKFKFYLKAYHKDRPIILFLNNKSADMFTALKEGNIIFSSLLKLKPGENILTFHTIEECDRPSELGLGDDTRCLSIRVENFSKIPVEYIIKENWDKTFDKNWYKKEEHENFIWMRQDGTISIYNFNNSLKAKDVVIYTRSFYKNRTLNIYLNNKLIDTYKIPSTDFGEILFPLPNLLPGENSLVLYSVEGCDVVNDVEKWEDYRCLSIGINRVYLVK